MIKLIKKFNLQSNTLFDSFNISYISNLKEIAKENGIVIIAGLSLNQNFNENEIINKIYEIKARDFSTIFIYPQNLSLKTAIAAINAKIEIISLCNKINIDIKKMINFWIMDIEHDYNSKG